MDEMLGHVAELKTKLKLNLICFKKTMSMRIPRGLMARILGFHPSDPGSSPGGGIYSIVVFSHGLKLKMD